jgi:hypothetical protein
MSASRVSQNYYYRRGDQQVGPVTWEQLTTAAHDGLLEQCEVWCEGWEAWRPARQVPELFADAADSRGAASPVGADHLSDASKSLWRSRIRDFGQQALRWLRLAGEQIQITARACWEQLQRLAAYGGGLIQARRLSREALRAQIALGERLGETSAGDPDLRTQLAQLAERRKSVQAAQASTNLLDAEQRGLYLRLSEPLLTSTEPPAAVAPQHRDAVSAQQAVTELAARQRERKAALFPADSRGRWRVVLGFTGGLVWLWLLVYPFVGGADRPPRTRSPDRERVVDGPPEDRPVVEPISPRPDLPAPSPPLTPPTEETPTGPDVTEPVTTPVESTDGPREVQLAEDDYFPARTGHVLFVDGEPHGEARHLDARSRLVCIENYEHGQLQGLRTTFYPSGAKFSESRFVRGVAQGKSSTYYDDGTLAATVNLVDGVPNGVSTTYFRNGSVCVEAEVVDGVTHGTSGHYRLDGVCFATSTWDRGVQVSQEVLLDPSQKDFNAIQEREAFSTLLKDHW